MLKRIIHELKHHAPFTALGAVFGIILMFFLRGISPAMSEELFYVAHPLHVLLSTLATAGMYKRYVCPTDRSTCNPFAILAIGYVGALGVATLSDSLLPYLGEALLKMPHRHAHIGFIEKWWLIHPLAILGITIAYFNPSTKFPHFGHVLLSTAASLFHLMMAAGERISLIFYAALLVFMFFSVWLPCCISDIVFPLLFIRKKE